MRAIPEFLSANQPLAEALISDFAAVRHLYESDLRNDESWDARASWLDQTEHMRLDRTALVSCLREYNGNHNPHIAVSKSLDALEQPGTLVIVGGQQSGLFTGPLLVIYKAITIIKAAEQASERLNRPVVPVFWIAGEDHDFDEVNHTYVLSPELQMERIRIERNDGKRAPVSYTPIEADEWNQTIHELHSLLPDTEFKAELMDQLKVVASQSWTLTDGFAKLLGQWFGSYGLVLLDSADPNLRGIEASVFEKIIMKNDDLEQAYRSAADDIITMKYEPQADVVEGGANLFYIHEGERLLLFKHEGEYTDRKRRVSFSKDEIIELVRLYPERFSNNVLTRPLMQDSVLPVLGTVLGGGEISYWGLTRKAFETMGMKMPIIVPRMSFTIVDGTLQKHMAKYDLSFEDVRDRLQLKRDEWLKAQDNLQLDKQFGDVKKSFQQLYNPIIEQLSTIQTGLVKLGNTNMDKILDQIDYLQKRAHEALETSNEAGLRHWDRLELTLFPNGKPQERVYNVFYYLNRYGLNWIDDLMGIGYDPLGQHRTIYL